MTNQSNGTYHHRLKAERRALRLALGASVTAICVWLLTRNIDGPELYRSLSNTDIRWIAAALLAYIVDYALRIERWRQILSNENPRLRWLDCAGPFFAGYAANNLLPLRAGDVIRALAFSRELGIAPGAIVATLFVERLLDLLSLLFLLGVAVLYFGKSVLIIQAGGIVTIGTVILVAALGIRFPQLIARIATGCCGLVRRMSPRLAKRLLTEVQAAVDSLHKVKSPVVLMRLVLLSTVIWLFESLLFWFSALAIPTLTLPIASLLALPSGTLATLMPSTPGFVGTFEYPIVVAMTALGNGASATTAYALLVHAVLAVPSVLLGTPYLLAYRFRSRATLAQV